MIKVIIILLIALCNCVAFKILFLLPYNGTSHHGYFTPLIEELAQKNHEVTVVNYIPMKNITNLKQISLQDGLHNDKRQIVMKQYYKNIPNYLTDVFILVENVYALQKMAKTNCEKIFTNNDVVRLIEKEEKFDVFILEQFYSDCGLAWANKIGVPTVGISAHVLLPWTYPRLGVPNNPAYVPSRIGKSGLWARMKAVFLNIYSTIYFRKVIQQMDHTIASKVLPDTPDLEEIARNISLVMVNQYFPLTGSRIYSPNVVEIGGMHIRMKGIQVKDLLQFLDTADNGVVYISFGSVACGLPETKIKAILKVISTLNRRFLWKVDKIENITLPTNLMIKSWIPQVDVLCHPKVFAFVTHSGMLSSVEAMHCGVPVISVPIFGDQFANAQSARESGLGVTIDFLDLDESSLNKALSQVLQEQYQSRAKYLSTLWRDRPMPPLDTAVYWIEYVAKYGGNRLRPRTVHLPLYQYLMLDVMLIIGSVLIIIFYVTVKVILFCLRYKGRKYKKNLILKND